MLLRIIHHMGSKLVPHHNTAFLVVLLASLFIETIIFLFVSPILPYNQAVNLPALFV